MFQRLRRLFTLLYVLSYSLLTPVCRAQTITTEPLRVTAVCPGSPFEVTFTTDRPYGAGNVFTAELFDGTNYRDLATAPATIVTTNRVSAIWRTSATMPADAALGTVYQLRIKASNPVVVGLFNSNRLTVQAQPDKPTVPSVPTSFCQGQPTDPLNATTTGTGLALVWYGTNATGGVGTIDPTRPSSVSAGPFTYYVAQRQSTCESERAAVPVFIDVVPGAALTGAPTIYPGESATLSVTFTAGGPWRFSYRDSSYVTGVGNAVQTVEATANPYTLTVKPATTTAYRLTEVSNACGSGTPAGGSVVVTVISLLGVEDQPLADAVDVFPVPATTTLTVRIRGLTPNQPARLQLADLAGRSVVQRQTKQETSTLPLDQVPTGTYLLRIQVGDRTASKRIVKF